MMASEAIAKNSDTFTIRHATSLDDLHWVIRMATEEGLCKKEAEYYFTAGLIPYSPQHLWNLTLVAKCEL